MGYNDSFYTLKDCKITHQPDRTVGVSFNLSQAPPSCYDCPFMGDSDGVFRYCPITGKEYDCAYHDFAERQLDCPFNTGGVTNA